MKLSEEAQLLEEEDLKMYGVVNVYGLFEEKGHVLFSCAVCGVKLFMAHTKGEAGIAGVTSLNVHRSSIGHRFNMSVACAEHQAELRNRHTAVGIPPELENRQTDRQKKSFSCTDLSPPGCSVGDANNNSNSDTPRRSYVGEIAAMYEMISLNSKV